MSAILDQLATFIQDIIIAMGYPGIVLIMLAENLFPPIPSELVMPFAGFIVGASIENFTLADITVSSPEGFTFVGVIIAGTLGAVVGAVILYYVGVWADELIARRFLRRWGKLFMLSEADLDRALGFFARFGDIIIFFGRLIPIIRSLISLPAGMNRMGMPRFLLFTTLGATVWNIFLTGAGVVLGANWEEILDFMDKYQDITLVVLVVLVVGFFAYRFWQRRRRPAKVVITTEDAAVE